ncbi:MULTISPECIES: thiamine-phosphate kinase [unclassified Leifsonia]|uniref:thiamine-phosphate kinase n=1 Tax=unclassified Leifsonia TaxID=2663824 RepID=UPI0006FF25D7|nr:MULTISPECIES: thiamine-phosphate kinase [unclassified Leifsonia]KQX07254.1 thiamine-monophosphate kinase [Leifsonia sp. Root1293]KRA11537.1 thiamine-monophosphate kinase [Leifsonia sp. Root60]
MDEASSPTVGELSELAVLARIFPRLPGADAALVGPGDDAAVISAPDARFVVTTDMMVHGPDFRLAWSTPFDLGWKAAATNLSDVAAMGAAPTALVVALAVPPTLSVSAVEGFADGLRAACAALAPGCGVVGGDLSVSDTFTIAVTAFGDLQGRSPVLRSGARPGDVVALAGELGLAAEGLGLLFRGGVDDQGRPDAGRATALRLRHPEAVDAQLAPSPPIGAGTIAAIGGATAMLDVSDGLALDAARIARASGVGIDFDSSALGGDVERALGGGEDHGLLATFPKGAVVPPPFRIIGQVTEDAGVVSVDGSQHLATGWDPYRGWDGAAG